MVGRPGRHARKPVRLPLVGAQVSTAGGFAPVVERAVAIGAEVVQVFSSNPRAWPSGLRDRSDLASLEAGLRDRGLPLFFHTIYLINLASPDARLRQQSGLALAHALTTGALARAAGVVTHMGSHRGDGFQKAVSRIVETTLAAVEAARESAAAQEPVAARTSAAQGSAATRSAAERNTPANPYPLPPLLLETGAGAGATIGGSTEELAFLLAALVSESTRSGVEPPGLGVCLDTAHLFAAGYPVHEPEGPESLISELDGLGLLPHVALVHLNDSSAPFASSRDRHENPGQGMIGYEGLARLVRHPALRHVPFVLEVPGQKGRGPGSAEVALVKSMREGAPAPRRAPVPGKRRSG